MRSGLVFNVSSRIPNRFLLCRMIAASARRMHRDGTSTSQSINNSLAALKDTKESQEDMMKHVGLGGNPAEIAHDHAMAAASASLP